MLVLAVSWNTGTTSEGKRASKLKIIQKYLEIQTVAVAGQNIKIIQNINTVLERTVSFSRNSKLNSR